MTTQLRQESSNAVLSPFSVYLREINQTPLLGATEEKELARQIHEGNRAARDHLVRANLRLVVNVARGYAGKGLSIEDLVEEGNLGLLRAIEGFDPEMNTRFSTYASFWIKQSIKRGLINTAKTVRVPAYMVELMSKWRRATSKLADELGRPPTHEEIARFMGLSKKKVNIIKKALRVYNSSHQTDPDWSLEEMLTADGPEVTCADDVSRVLKLVEGMEKREATVLRLRFGLNDESPMTLKQIGEHLGLTRERVRQIEGAALAKLGDQMGTN